MRVLSPSPRGHVPLLPGGGHRSYLAALDRIALPALSRFRPDLIVVASGLDANALDPLARMLAHSDTYREMTGALMQAADSLCGGRLVMVHEGGYSEVYVPFCGHAVLEELSGALVHAPDPMAATLAARQPDARFDAFVAAWIDEAAKALGL